MSKLNLTEDPYIVNKGLLICRTIHPPHTFGIFYGENPLQFSFPLVLLEISTIIAISRLIRYLLKPLRQPRIISDILGGIIVGPSVLSRSKRFRNFIFPDTADYTLKNIGLIGFMYFLFISGVKTDLSQIKKAGKKQWYIAIFGVSIPMLCSLFIGIGVRKSMKKELSKASSMLGLTSEFAITAFPVIYPIIRELNLLSSEIGRMALSTALISDVIGIQFIVAFEAAKQGEEKSMYALWFLISLFLIGASIFGGVRRIMILIINATPEGKSVEQIYVVFILLGVLVSGFLCDLGGIELTNGPLWLGLAIPDGPPLGSTLVEKSETIVMDILMPFSFAYVGFFTDISSMYGHWSQLRPIFLMAVTAYVVKIVTVLFTAYFLNMPFRDCLALSLVLSLRGEIEFLIFIHWLDLKMITRPYFTMLILMTIGVTAIVTPLISIVYDPTRPYMIHTRRNIQHTASNTELHVIACIHDEENMPGIINLLEVSNPTTHTPFFVHALHLMKLVGRAAPVFIDHKDEQESDNTNQNPIHNALKLFQQGRGEDNMIKLHSYTSYSPKRTMYQDICKLALEKKASLIILPFYKDEFERPSTSTQVVNSNVLKHAPCSVAILVDRGLAVPMRQSIHHFALLFTGGADAREALSYADRMAANPDVSLTAVRFLSHNGEGDNEMEKKLDDGLVTWFWVKNEGNDKVMYKEVIVKNGEDTIAAIQAMKNEFFHLWILGRNQGVNPVLLQGLTDWSDENELGVIGDFLVSMNSGSTSSVLVVKQQILRGQEPSCISFLEKFTSCGL
ncbi:PREDICTED: cation/H(+) antiporter 24 isoform X1 [Nicotiana attenuata]|uniref:Cationh(+) antiporter 24 n=2 Tax=Nicotiana attenuata TaxID=49451 RepID=A0A1J6J0I0_NICAT|nr:PREDICTED: cation/H(+) antiporter 24 isoform X1 [Nicotiana attenuata]OIT00785.1 cationh(+) antiporter 24 [Nicotiana attenuata]